MALMYELELDIRYMYPNTKKRSSSKRSKIRARTGRADTFLLPWPWPWPDDLHIRTWSSVDIPVYQKVNFLRQSFRKLSYYRHTHWR